MYVGAGIWTVKVNYRVLGVFPVRGTGFERAMIVAKWKGCIKKVAS